MLSSLMRRRTHTIGSVVLLTGVVLAGMEAVGGADVLQTPLVRRAFLLSPSTTLTMPDLNLQYPLGRFASPNNVTSEERTRFVQQVGGLPDAVRTAVEGLSDDQLDTSYRPGGWTVRQVVHHLADSHLNGYVRFRWTLTEDEPTIKAYDQDAWAELGDARQMAVAPSLALLDALHARWVQLCRSLSDADWARAFFHPKSGRVTLDAALALYAWHGRHHTAHITTLREREGW